MGKWTEADQKAYDSSPARKKARAARNRARRLMVKKYGASAVKGKTIDHTNGNPNDNRPSNLSIMSAHKNYVKQ
jgi:hypothetical protein